MSVTPQSFADYANEGSLEDGMADSLEQARALVEEYARANVPADIFLPDSIYDQAVLAAASHLWDQRQSPNGQLNSAFGNGEVAAPIRISRDPLAPVRPLLAQWVTPLGFA